MARSGDSTPLPSELFASIGDAIGTLDLASADMSVWASISRAWKCVTLWEELLPRLKPIEIAGEGQLIASEFVSGPKSVPMRYQLM